MALPATESFTSTAGNLADPPWFNAHNTGGSAVAKNGAGKGKPAVLSTDALMVWDSDTFANDQYSKYTAGFVGLGTGADYLYLLSRATKTGDFNTAGSGYWWWSDGGSDTQILSNVAGSQVSIASANATAFTIGDVFQLQCSGTAISTLKNSVSIMSATNSAVASGSAGMGGYNDTATTLFDDWEGGNLSSTTIVDEDAEWVQTVQAW